MKLTKKRQEILDIILKCQKPVTAKFLKSEVSFYLSTVYRSLDYLAKNNFIFSFEYENEKYYFKDENMDFFVCDSCKIMETLTELSQDKQELRKKQDTLEKKGFSFTSQLSIIKGQCNNCNKK